MADVHLVLVQWLLDLILILIDHIYMQQILLELISNGKQMQLDTIQRLLKNIFRKIIPKTYQVKISSDRDQSFIKMVNSCFRWKSNKIGRGGTVGDFTSIW